MRSRIPGLLAGKQDASYLSGESGDWLGKLELPVLGGRARLLGYENGNEIDAAAEADPLSSEPRRHSFEWRSGSFGAEWSGDIAGAGVKLLGWSANGSSVAAWEGTEARSRSSALRRDLGVLGTAQLRSGGTRTVLGMRFERSRTAYEVKSDSTVNASLDARTPVLSAFAQHSRAVRPGVELTVGASLANADARLHLGPQAQLRWKPDERVTLTGSYARTHQFAQSLRNAESVVGNVFPPDLFIGAGAPGVPTARSDQGVIAAEYRPTPGVRLGAEAYHRATTGLLLVAPREGGPFTTGSFEVGSGRSSGVSVEAGVSSARYGLVAGYGMQRVRLTYGGSGYVPDHGTTHLLQSGLIVFPSATTSVRLGAVAALGRRTTTATGALEWEACNLLDQGCEFGGSPHYNGDPLGATSLPAYIRVDLGIRKHWHFQVAGRDAMVALFGTVTNVLNRKNVLTYVRNPTTGERVPIEMRPLAPLLVGLDWRF
jgi:hypothetical protein